MGHPDVAHLEAGFNDWKKAGEPVQDISNSARWMRKPEQTVHTDDGRPPVWIGHAALFVPDIAATKDFFMKLGLRLVGAYEHVVVMELRGGTHLILLPANKPVEALTVAPFDLMVDDIDATHAAYAAAGLRPSAIEDGDIHRAFTVTEPGGHRITVNSTHVTGLPV
jgi:catechol 2,3-dioxygenase-like lactoylglutathione lyase family enzyme